MLSILLFILELIIIPYLLGVVIVRKKDFCLRLLIGFSSYMALFFILYFIGIGCSMRLHELMTIFMTAVGSVIIAFFLCRFFVSKKNGETFSIVSELKSDDYSSFKKIFMSSGRFVKIITIAAISLVLFQAFRMIFVSPYIDGDDTTYATLVQSMASLDSIYNIGKSKNGIFQIYQLDKRYQVSSYYPFLAGMAVFCRVHSLVFLKTFIPVLYILMSYSVAWLFAKLFFKEKLEKKSIFILILAVINEFSFGSYYSFGRRLLMWTWNSKSICFTIILPLLLYLTVEYYDAYQNADNEITFSSCFFYILVVNTACASITLMGTILGAISLFILAIVFAIQKKKIIPALLLIPSMLPYFVNLLFIRTWR